MTGTKAPGRLPGPLKNRIRGVVGWPDEDPLDRLERLALRAARKRAREERREESARTQARLRKDAVGRRRKAQMLAAEYARDRRRRDSNTTKEGSDA